MANKKPRNLYRYYVQRHGDYLYRQTNKIIEDYDTYVSYLSFSEAVALYFEKSRLNIATGGKNPCYASLKALSAKEQKDVLRQLLVLKIAYAESQMTAVKAQLVELKEYLAELNKNKTKLQRKITT